MKDALSSSVRRLDGPLSAKCPDGLKFGEANLLRLEDRRELLLKS